MESHSEDARSGMPARGHTSTPPRRTSVPGTPRRTVKITGRPGERNRSLVEIERRRPARSAQDRVASRPDKVARWALVMGISLVLVAAASSRADADTIGTAASSKPQARYAKVGLGNRTLETGMRGSDVKTLQRLLSIGADGEFGPMTARAVTAFQRRAGLTADGVVGRDTRSALIRHRMGARTATWYGPGLYGNRTACGQTLTESTRGIAHRTLPCGRTVTLYYKGRFVSTRVIDRGPYTSGVTLDLTAAVAKALRLTGTDRVHARY